MYEIYCMLRDSKGLKDADVARATGITKSTFADWKSGRSSPKLDKLQKIADYFGVTVDYLMTGEDEKKVKIIPTNYDVARELTATLDQLSSDNTLMFNGLKLTEEGRLLLKNSIETAIENARIISERKKKD